MCLFDPWLISRHFLSLIFFLSCNSDLGQIFASFLHVPLGLSLASGMAVRRRIVVFENRSGTTINSSGSSSSMHRSRNAEWNQEDNNQEYLKDYNRIIRPRFMINEIITKRTLNQLATSQGCKVTVRTRISQAKLDSSEHETGTNRVLKSSSMTKFKQAKSLSLSHCTRSVKLAVASTMVKV